MGEGQGFEKEIILVRIRSAVGERGKWSGGPKREQKKKAGIRI